MNLALIVLAAVSVGFAGVVISLGSSGYGVLAGGLALASTGIANLFYYRLRRHL